MHGGETVISGVALLCRANDSKIGTRLHEGDSVLCKVPCLGPRELQCEMGAHFHGGEPEVV